MLLYKTQPKGVEETSVINLDTKVTLLQNLGKISVFNGKNVHIDDFTPLVTDAAMIDGLIVSRGYQNILVVTSFEDGNYERELKDTV